VSSTQAASIQRVIDGSVSRESTDVLAVEEPLEIRLGFTDGKHRAISITMRTPGDDAELAAGFLFTEGIIKTPDQIGQIRHCGSRTAEHDLMPDSRGKGNTIRVDLNGDLEIDLKRLERNFYTTSSCGVCGKSSIDALKTGAQKVGDPENPKIDSELIRFLPERLRESQAVFDRTGGLHASALFTTDGELEIVREDVGRHNALDKVIGAKFLEGALPLSRNMLLVSGRASFELVQKALMAGIPVMFAVGAPSSLAVELAKELGMTLIGFVRGESFNVYSGADRIV
jgi:FdhD protein